MKDKAREKSLEARKAVKDKSEKSRKIKDKVLCLSEWEKAENVMLYVSFGSEVQTLELIEKALSQGKRVLVPVVEGKEMRAVVLEKMEFVKSSLGVPEPVDVKRFPREAIDLVIAPGVCFDQQGNRIGYGGGYYDRFLEGFEKPVIALSFEDQLCGSLPCELHDQKVKKIVTEKRIIECEQK